jgi:hypothetical protein
MGVGSDFAGVAEYGSDHDGERRDGGNAVGDLGDEFVSLGLVDQVGGSADLVNGDVQPAMFDWGDGEPGVRGSSP